MAISRKTAPIDYIADFAETTTTVGEGEEAVTTVTGISFPIASMPEAGADEVVHDTGDMRKVALAFCQQLYEVYATTDYRDRPSRMTVECVPSTLANGNERREYRFIFETAGPGLDVVAE
jgi:hypothetical protein